MGLDEILKLICEIEIKRKRVNVGLFDALGYVFASDIYALRDLPSFDNSALDGYAFAYDDKNMPLKVCASVLAGDMNEYKISKGECYKTMTGAPFAEGCDTLVAIEQANFNENGELLIPSDIKKGNALKLRGEELKKGELLFRAGQILNPSAITMLAAQGIAEISVFAKPRLCVFCTGSEIKEPGEVASNKQIYNSNASAILSLLASNHYSANYLGIVKDNKTSISRALQHALNSADIVITSGGASKGDADYMASVLGELGFEALFNSIAFRPASPTKLFKKDGKFVLVSPGNPLSCFVACYFVLLTLIRHFLGYKNPLAKTQNATLKSTLHFKSGRDNLIIGSVKDGVFSPYNDGKFSPSQILPLIKSNAFSIANDGISVLEANSKIKIYKF